MIVPRMSNNRFGSDVPTEMRKQRKTWPRGFLDTANRQKVLYVYACYPDLDV
jgi:hypothetical protein